MALRFRWFKRILVEVTGAYGRLPRDRQDRLFLTIRIGCNDLRFPPHDGMCQVRATDGGIVITTAASDDCASNITSLRSCFPRRARRVLALELEAETHRHHLARILRKPERCYVGSFPLKRKFVDRLLAAASER